MLAIKFKFVLSLWCTVLLVVFFFATSPSLAYKFHKHCRKSILYTDSHARSCLTVDRWQVKCPPEDILSELFRVHCGPSRMSTQTKKKTKILLAQTVCIFKFHEVHEVGEAKVAKTVSRKYNQKFAVILAQPNLLSDCWFTPEARAWRGLEQGKFCGYRFYGRIRTSPGNNTSEIKRNKCSPIAIFIVSQRQVASFSGDGGWGRCRTVG